jgi:hypothetical protein
MPIPTYANINDTGVLISTLGLNTLQLSSDQTVLSVGPGNKWAGVQTYLKPYGLAAVGGRVGIVGVPGYTLGGGISFYGNAHGFTSANVVNYEVVLASGAVANVNATSYSDLFWALKGGGNSFALVTRFDMKVYPSPQCYVGIAAFAPTDRVKFLDAVYYFGKYGSQDEKAAVIPLIFPTGGTGLASYSLFKFYDEATLVPSASNVQTFSNFTIPKMVPLVDTFSRRHISDFLNFEIDAPTSLVSKERNKFHIMSSTVDRDALDIVHNALSKYVGAANDTLPIAGLVVNLAIQPITQRFISQSLPVPQFDSAYQSRGPYFWYNIGVSWALATDDGKVEDMVNTIDAEVNTAFNARGIQGKFLYMNDADKGQKIFENYPAANLARLKSIRSKYDPGRVFTDLMPGGWKVANAA